MGIGLALVIWCYCQGCYCFGGSTEIVVEEYGTSKGLDVEVVRVFTLGVSQLSAGDDFWVAEFATIPEKHRLGIYSSRKSEAVDITTRSLLLRKCISHTSKKWLLKPTMTVVMMVDMMEVMTLTKAFCLLNFLTL